MSAAAVARIAFLSMLFSTQGTGIHPSRVSTVPMMLLAMIT
jgi:hypothetical protein